MLPITSSLCIQCKGRLWCGLDKCPILEKFEAKKQALPQIKNKKFEGHSPPGAFVSWKNYPNVSIAPLATVTQQKNDLSENPEQWFGLSSNEIINLRSQLIQSNTKMNIKNAGNPTRELSKIQELCLSTKPVMAEFVLKKEPKAFLSFNETVAPIGIMAELEKMTLTENPKIPSKVDSFFSDAQTKAGTATIELYKNNFPVHYLQRLLSAGTLGVKKNRKLIPTRWSITAIDSNVSKYLLDKHVKEFPQTNEFELFHEKQLGNQFFVLLVPANWSFEMLECWLPGAGWALYAEQNETNVICDFEPYAGRTKYADKITGAYYAARIAIAEHLVKRKRQATAIVFREIFPDYSVPLGVWVIRETVRKALSGKPISFSSLELAISYVSARLAINLEKYLHASTILMNLKKQKKINEWFF